MSARPLLQLVHNPGSGNHDPGLIKRLAAEFECAGYHVEEAVSARSAPYVPRSEAQHVCVAGGDGTVRHVVSALASAGLQPDFSVYPAGTINLVAREWGAPREVGAFVAHALQPRTPLYIVSVNDTHIVACLTLGPDARAVAEVSEPLKARIGRFAYGVALAKIALNWVRPALSVTIDGATHQGEALYLAKGRYFAGPWSFAQEAALGEPLLHAVILKRARRRDFLRFLLQMLRGDVREGGNLIVRTGAFVAVAANMEHPVQIDGDPGPALPLDIRLTGVRLNGRGEEIPLPSPPAEA